MITLLIILIIGIDIKCAINPIDNLVVIDCYIFKTIVAFKIKILLHNSFFYIKIGKKPFRKLKIKKLDGSNIKFPKINISKFKLNSSLGSEDEPILTTILWGISSIFGNSLKSILAKKINIKSYSSTNIPDYSDDTTKIGIYFTIKFSILKIIYFILRKIMISRKNKKNEVENGYRKFVS